MRRYVVIGAGALGMLAVAQFELAGIDSVLVARGRALESIRARGVTVRRPHDVDVVHVEVAERPELQPDDVLVLATKAQDAEAALAAWSWRPVAGGGLAADLPIVTLQNGLATEDLALRRFARVYGASVAVAASHLVAGEVVSPSWPIIGVIRLGRHAGVTGELAASIAADLRASGWDALDVPDVAAWKARKLLGNVGNALDLLEGTDEQRAEARAAITAEAADVLEAAGVAVAGDFPRLDIAPVPGHVLGRLSTWQSRARGASLETDYLNGEIVLLARRAGVPAPFNERLQRLVAGSADVTLLTDLLSPEGLLV